MGDRERRFDFGVYIGINRERRGLTGTQLGAACGVSQTKYSDWERVKSLPDSEDVVRAIAEALAVDQAELLRIWTSTIKQFESKGAPIITRTYKSRKKRRTKQTTEAYPVKR